VVDFCEHGNENSDSIKGMEFDLLRYYQFLKKDSAPRSYLFSYIRNCAQTV
jgi:hypothetical protein